MVPSALLVLDSFPLTSNAKVDRKALPAPDSSGALDASGYLAPRDALEEALVRIWEELLGTSPIGVRTNFFELGGHSLLAVRLMARIREHTGHSLPISALFQGATVERLAQLARGQDGRQPGPNLTRLQVGQPGQRPLFLVHGGGGAVLGYSELVRHLPVDRPVYGLHAPGLEGGEPPPASVEALAHLYLAQLRAVQPQGPYLLAGWSFGGLVAYELARQLQASGEQVELLALFDSQAPTGQPRPAPPPLAQLASFGQTLGLPLHEVTLDMKRLEGLEGREQLAAVLEQLRTSPSGAPQLDLDTAERLFTVARRLSEAQRTYVPASPYTGPALLFQASTASQPRAGDLGWSAWLTGPLTVYEVPGDHFTLLHAPHASALAERLAHHLRLLDRDAP